MAHGEAARPIESKDGHDLAIDLDGTAPVADSKAVKLLAQLLAAQAETNKLLAKIAKVEPPQRCVSRPHVTIPSTTTAQELLPEDADRGGAVVYNASTAILYVLFGKGDASATQYSYPIASNTLWEFPSWCITDRVSGVWASANGSAEITPFVRLTQ